MKVIVVGDWLGEIYEKAIFDAFREIGCKTYKFSWIQYFKYYQYSDKFETDNNFLKKMYYKMQNRFKFGPTLYKINKDLITFCDDINPDLVFIYRGTHIFPKTIKRLKENNITVFGYNNDDPFSRDYPDYFWRHFLKGIKYYDHIFAYRKKNISDYYKKDYKDTSLLRSYYIKDRNYPLNQELGNEYKNDVIFIGHYENDGRDEYIRSIIKQDIDFKLYGTDWRNSKYYNYFRKELGEIKPVYNNKYNKVINGSKIALVFLSKKNNDTYTRRCFEIPATKTFMLSEYTDDLNSLFKRNKEAVYFTSKKEMLKKIDFYLKNDEKRDEIAKAGFNRVVKDGHSSVGRAYEILRVYNENCFEQ